ncbi:fimbrial protein [Acinetobacter terrestris]|uniref:fimbrial protein n=1 Tax=Acinetobacter terrestris TaxID=2529843 RepID=UPI0035258DB1
MNKFLMALLGILILPDVYASESVEILIQATVGTTCSVSTNSQTIDLGNISVSTEAENMENYSKSFDLIANCPSATSYKYSFSTTDSIVNNCIASSKDQTMLFCLKDNQNNQIQLSNDDNLKQFTGELEDGKQTTSFKIVPALNAPAGPLSIGEHQGHLLVKISPD